MNNYKLLKYFLLFGLLVICILFELNILYDLPQKYETPSDEFQYDMALIETIHEEIKCFPVLKENDSQKYPVNYENSWGELRSYGGERLHEGCDLMAEVNERGRYIVCSMTDGSVKNIGWLEQGGWRIGIESDNGVYYYYAHLDSYEKAFQIGERIQAGQILGRMGDSGYGKEPDTKGNFDVHLHVGIYVKDIKGTERAVNPYWYLKPLEN